MPAQSGQCAIFYRTDILSYRSVKWCGMEGLGRLDKRAIRNGPLRGVTNMAYYRWGYLQNNNHGYEEWGSPVEMAIYRSADWRWDSEHWRANDDRAGRQCEKIFFVRRHQGYCEHRREKALLNELSDPAGERCRRSNAVCVHSRDLQGIAHFLRIFHQRDIQSGKRATYRFWLYGAGNRRLSIASQLVVISLLNGTTSITQSTSSYVRLTIC